MLTRMWLLTLFYPRRNLVLRDVAQPGSAPALGAGCRRFKSSRPDQFLFQSEKFTIT